MLAAAVWCIMLNRRLVWEHNSACIASARTTVLYIRGLTAAKKKETTMSQITSFWKAMNACWKLSVFVKIVTVTARKAHAPVGKGSKTSPAAHGRGHVMLGGRAVTESQRQGLQCMRQCSQDAGASKRQQLHLIAQAS